MTDLAIVGRIRKPQGIQGELTVELLTGEPDRFFAPGCRLVVGTVDGDPSLTRPRDAGTDASGLQYLTVSRTRPFREGLIVSFEEIPDRTAAELWRQRYLLVPVSELTPPAEDEVFAHDLMGMRVQTDTGRDIGEVVALYEMPQGLTLDVRGATRKLDVLVPYRNTVVREVDLDTRVITVDSTCGLFD